MTTTEPSSRDEQIADKLLDAAIGIEAVADLLHGLGTAKRDGGFIIEGDTVKWIADQIKPICKTMLDLEHELRTRGETSST